eukprot:g5844.t1
MDLFWRKGYHSTSISDLTEATGVQRQSLYNAIGDKRDMFIRSLLRYNTEVRQRLQASLEARGDPVGSIRLLFDTVLCQCAEDPDKRGCFLVNTALALESQDDEIRLLVASAIEETRMFFEKLIEHGKVRGEISRDVDSAAAAAGLLATLVGIRVLARGDIKPGLPATTKRGSILHRKLTPELMDDPALGESDHRTALAGLAQLNRVAGVRSLLWREIRPLARGLDRPLRVLDVATGSADIPVGLARLAKRDLVHLDLHACDISPTALAASSRRAMAAGVTIELHEINAVTDPIGRRFDVITCSLFLHHLDAEDSLALLRNLAAATDRMLLVTDLRRDTLGLALAWIASRTLTGSRVVRVDALKSVRAAYTPTELRQLGERAGLEGAAVCGGCLAPAGVTRLRAMGMIDAGFDLRSGALSTLRLCSAWGSCTLPIRPYRAVDRRSFDASLVERAAAAGVEVLTNARAAVRPDDGVDIDMGSVRLALAPRVVVVADGLDGNSLAGRTDYGWSAPPRGPLGLGAVVPASSAHQDPGEIRMAVGADGYVGFAMMAPGVLAVGAALSAGAVKQRGPSAVVRGVLAEAAVSSECVHGARWRGVARLTRSRAGYARGRVMVVGDAAQYVEPLTGEGMSWAILCASSIAPYAERAARGKDVHREWTRFCRRSLRSRRLADPAPGGREPQPVLGDGLMPPRVLGIGCASPAHVVSADDGLELVLRVAPEHDPAWLRSLYLESGVLTRGSVLSARSMREWCSGSRGAGPTTSERLRTFAEAAPPLVESAVRQAIACSRVDPGAISHVVTVSCTGAESPGLDHALIERIGLDRGVSRTHIGFMGCHGALNALAVADAFVRANPDAVVLVICCELCSLHYQTGPVARDQIIANAIFADGASCAVVGSQGSGPELRGFSSRVFEGTADLMRWSIGDYGFRMRLSARVPVMLRRVIASWIDEWLETSGLQRSQITRWCLHPGGRDILDCIEQGLQLSPAATAGSREILRRHGNMSSGTVLWVMRDAIGRKERGPMVSISFGPGLSGEAMLLA